MARKKMGQILLAAGLITEDQLVEALDKQKQTKRRRLGKILVEMGLTQEENICRALSAQLNLPFVTVSGLDIPREVVEIISRKQAESKLILAIGKQDRRLRLAMANPLDLGAIADVKFRTGLDVTAVIATEQDIRKAIEQNYKKEEIDFDLISKVMPSAEVELLPEAPESDAEYNVDELIRQSEIAPIVRLANAILADSIKLKASDIHIEPQEKEVVVRYRVDGMMKNIFKVGLPVLAPLVSRIKIIGAMDISVKRRPQDGRTRLKVANKHYDLRISTLPTIFGEKVVIRILDQARAFISLADLGFNARELGVLTSILSRPQGIVLVTGPTGSGKSSTLYGALNHLRSEVINIVTVEDPVEYQLPGINQVQVNERAGITFATGLRSILRQDPNVVMVGEIRDAETAKIAFQAANTGHLVLSTLHTNDAPSAVTRLIDLGIDPFVIGSSLLCVLAQRLVRRNCPHCLVPDATDEDVLARLDISPREAKTLKKGKGCEACQFTGYSGRAGIFELLTINEELRKLIVKGAADSEIAATARRLGIKDLHGDGIDKACQGVTSIEELMRVAPPPERDSRHAEAVKETAAAREEGKPEPLSKQLRILAVDDDPFIRTLLEKVLSEARYEVVLATDGEEALAKVYRDMPDLIISDVVMPKLDGLELVKKLKGHLQTSMIPVILLTSRDEVESEVEGLEAGADDYIPKPIVTSRLLARIGRIMSIYDRTQ
jgi:type IV pilus assembly protein PilB